MSDEEFKPDELLKPIEPVGLFREHWSEPKSLEQNEPLADLPKFGPRAKNYLETAANDAYLLMGSILGHGKFPPDDWEPPDSNDLNDIIDPPDRPPNSGQGAKGRGPGPDLSGGGANLYGEVEAQD